MKATLFVILNVSLCFTRGLVGVEILIPGDKKSSKNAGSWSTYEWTNCKLGGRTKKIARHDLPYTTPLIFTLHTLIGTRSNRTWFFSPVRSGLISLVCVARKLSLLWSISVWTCLEVFSPIWSGLVWSDTVQSLRCAFSNVHRRDWTGSGQTRL